MTFSKESDMIAISKLSITINTRNRKITKNAVDSLFV
jgi:hypothetical protein